MNNHENLTFEQKAIKTKQLEAEYKKLSFVDKKESLRVEKEYLALRASLIADFDNEQGMKKSENMVDVLARVAKKVKPQKIKTGITVLDYQLVNDKEKLNNVRGGFTLGNFINIAGERGAGKTTILTKMFTNFSKTERVSWFDFEMGEDKIAEQLTQFDFTPKNIEYYTSSRFLEEIVIEVKILYMMGIRHFVIDSMMKINVKGKKRGYETVSHISSVLSELTSRLNINIYMINQMSSDDQRTGTLMMKHGNDVEYDSDYMFFILKKKTGRKNEIGLEIYDDSARLIVCVKNRPDNSRLFSVEIPKSAIFGISPTDVEVIEYESDDNITYASNTNEKDEMLLDSLTAEDAADDINTDILENRLDSHEMPTI